MQQEHAHIVNNYFERKIGPRCELTEVFFGRVERELGGAKTIGVGGQFREQFAQAAIEVWFGGRLLGRCRQIEPADIAEKRGPYPLKQKASRIIPTTVAGERKLIEIGTNLTVRKIKWRRKRGESELHRPTIPVTGEESAVVVAIVRLRGIHFVANRTLTGHGDLKIANRRNMCGAPAVDGTCDIPDLNYPFTKI